MTTLFSTSQLFTAPLPEYLEELDKVKNSILHNHNIFVFSEASQPTTVLVSHLQKSLGGHFQSLYIDLKKALSPRSLLSYMTRELLTSNASSLKDMFTFAQQYLPNLKPQITRQAGMKTGVAIDYTFGEPVIYGFIKELFDALERMAADQGIRLLIIFDNYDIIGSIDKRKTEDIIRDKVNLHRNVQYVFICTSEDAAAQIFDKKNAPKYRIKGMHAFHPLSQDSVRHILTDHFDTAGLHAEPNVIDFIMTVTQSLVNAIRLCRGAVTHAKAGDAVSRRAVQAALRDILLESATVYSILWDSCSPHQKNLLFSLAAHGGQQVFSARFLRDNDLGSAPSVQTSINALTKRGILVKINREFFFRDSFFKEWVLQEHT